MLLSYLVACGDCGHIADEHDNGGNSNDECSVSDCDCLGYVADEDDYQRIATDGAVSDRLTLAAAEQIVGEPARNWACRCFEIASKLADHVGGVAVYGAWDGPIAPGTPFSRRPLGPNHGWVLLPDGQIFDPTRWVFEGLAPYLYEGEADYYDEGRNRFRAQNLPPYPPRTGDVIHLELDAAAADHIAAVTGTAGDRSLPEWAWCANLPWDTLDGHAPALYAALNAADLGVLIPIDNRLRAERAAA